MRKAMQIVAALSLVAIAGWTLYAAGSRFAPACDGYNQRQCEQWERDYRTP